MEVSSHGLAFDRAYGVPYAAAVFTNLAGDHLDFHQTMENYFLAKQQLFLGQGVAGPGVSVLNVDSDYGRRLQSICSGRTVLYGLENPSADITAVDVSLTAEGTRYTLRTPEGTYPVRSALVGRANLYNLLAAGAAAFALGVDPTAIVAGCEALQRVPGRFERVEAGQSFGVLVDFAHTDLAFENLLETVRALTQKRIIFLFGSGGDRDRTKRPVLGEIAGRLADQVILTTDNPRSEDPAQIVKDIEVGVKKAGGSYEIVPDRAEAVLRAMERARPGDMVVLAGKGHQDTQIYADRTEPWSEIGAARRALAQLGFGEVGDEVDDEVDKTSTRRKR